MELLTTVLKVNLVFSVLFVAYLCLFRKETFFVANRVWLVGSALMAWLLPWFDLAERAGRPDLRYELPVLNGALGGADTGVWPGASDPWLLAYLGGVSIAMFLLGRRLLHVRAVFRSGGDEAFSFLRRIALPPGKDARTMHALNMHESAHVRLGHSYDVLCLELLAALSWWNPLWRWGIKELRTVHEYQADADAAGHCPDYDRLLLAHAFGVPTSTLTNSFRSSTLKKRMTMLYRERSPRKAGLKYALIVPVLLIAFGSTAWTAVPLHTDPQVDLAKVDKQPEFPGGMEAMIGYMGANTKYPDEAKKAGVQGTVYIEFVIDATGKVGQVQVKRGVNASLDKEAARVVASMPDWKPGEQGGKKVAVRYILPVKFQLSE